MKVAIGIHHPGIIVEIPDEFSERTWNTVQDQIIKYFQEFQERGEIAPVLSGMGPVGGESSVAFAKAWSKAVAEHKLKSEVKDGE